MALTATKMCVNLHVQNVKQSLAFFTGLGFEFDAQGILRKKKSSTRASMHS